jgi:hypothetical protein
VLRRIFGPKRDKVTGEWRKLHNEELHDLYSSPSIIRITKSRRMRWVGHIAQMAEKRNAYRLLVGKPEGKSPLGRPRRRWLDNIYLRLWMPILYLFKQTCFSCYTAMIICNFCTINIYHLLSRCRGGRVCFPVSSNTD